MARKKHRQKQKQMRQKPQPKIVKTKSNRKLWIAFAVIAVVIIAVGAVVLFWQLNQNPNQTGIEPTKVLLETTAGNITIDLRTDKPITSGNFINLVEAGEYDGATFYRVIETFVIQGGLGGGSVATINDEIGSNNHNTEYTVAMAKTDQPNSASSEFFINTADNSKRILQDGSKFDDTYTVFGTVIEGQDVVDEIASAPVEQNPYTGEISVPVDPVTIIRATIIS